MERRKLQKMIMGDESGDTPSKRKDDLGGGDAGVDSGPPKVLRITRTFRNQASQRQIILMH